MNQNTIRSAVVTLGISLAGLGTAWAGVDQTKLLPSDGEQQDYFGTAVAVFGDTAAVGAPDNSNENGPAGAVYMFGRSGNTWVEQQKLLAGDVGPDDGFGTAVALHGETLVVGAPFDDDNGTQSGSAYVFTRVGGNWIQQAKLVPADGDVEGEFGHAVAVYEDTIVISSPFYNSAGTGRAYVFMRTGSVWNLTKTLVPFDGNIQQWFGSSVAIDDNTIAIGARLDDDNGPFSGAVYVYQGSGWPLQAKLKPSDGAAEDEFGVAVDLEGDLLIAGAFRNDEGASNQGAAYVFRRTGNAWNEDIKLQPSDGPSSSRFGYSVDLHGDSLVVGAFYGGAGSAYVFDNTRGEWTERVKLAPANLANNSRFGWSVALFGDSVVVGAPLDDPNGFQSGSAYAFDFQPDDVPAVGGIGAVMLMLAALGSGAWFTRRR